MSHSDQAKRAHIRVPTLVVHGTEDPVYPYDHAEVLARGIPTATLVRWEAWATNNRRNWSRN